MGHPAFFASVANTMAHSLASGLGSRLAVGPPGLASPAILQCHFSLVAAGKSSARDDECEMGCGCLDPVIGKDRLVGAVSRLGFSSQKRGRRVESCGVPLKPKQDLNGAPSFADNPALNRRLICGDKCRLVDSVQHDASRRNRKSIGLGCLSSPFIGPGNPPVGSIALRGF